MSKKCTPLWREAHFQVRMYKKHTSFGTLLEVEMSKNGRRRGAEHISRSKVQKPEGYGAFFRHSDVVLRRRRSLLCTLSKVSKNVRVCIAVSNTMAGVFFQRIWQDACRVAGAVQETHELVRCVRRSGQKFLDRGCIRENEIFRFSAMILRDRCSTSYDLASLFCGSRHTFRDMDWKKRKTHWYQAVSSALNFPSLKEVLQNCFAFDVIKFKSS